MHIKRKYIFFLCTLLATLTISYASIQVNNNNSIISNPINDVKNPTVSDANIDHIEFVQSGGHAFTYDSVDLSNNYLETGDGPFTMRLYLTSPIGSDERLRVTLTGYDPSYHSTLHLDTAMMDELPTILQAIIGVVPYAELALHSTSRNEIVKDFTGNGVSQGGYYVYEWTPSQSELYKYQTRIYLGTFDLTDILELLGLEDLIAGILPDLYPTEPVQNIKYDAINQFSFLEQQRHSFLGITWWTDITNGVHINGDTATTYNLDVPNEDHTAPTYSIPESSQESAVDDWQIKIGLHDEFEGSGIKNDSVYIWYSVNGGTFIRINSPMLVVGNYFYGTLPNQLANSEIQYYVTFSDRAGNEVQTQTYTFYANPLEIQPIAILLIGIAIATIATIAATRIYRNRHQPRVITLPSKKKVDKYYKNVKKEGGNM